MKSLLYDGVTWFYLKGPTLTFRFSVQPPLDFIPPNLKPWVIHLSYKVLPLLLKVRLRPWLPAGIQQVTVNNGETLAQLFEQFQTHKVRLLIAFRHVEVDDPLCMGYMFSRAVPHMAKQQNIALKGTMHSYFMYDRGMSLWAGAWLKTFFSWMGGIPVRRGARDLKAIKTARNILVDGQFPLTIAPEGATNGHSELLSPLEPGVAQLAFWGVQDLQRQQRQESVMVLPVSIRYRCINPDWGNLDRLLASLEVDCGLVSQSCVSQSPSPSMNVDVEDYYQRLQRIGIQMLSYTEDVDRRFYNASLGDPIGVVSQKAQQEDQRSSEPQKDLDEQQTNGAIAQHLQPLLDEMLKVGERSFGLSSDGDLPTRCRRLEEAGWTRIYRDDLDLKHTERNRGTAGQGLSAMERGFADRVAAESQLHMEHMRLVESMVAVTGHYVKDDPSFERFAETALLLFDVMQHIKGVKVPARPRLGWRQAYITVGNPLSATERGSAYKQDRKAAKEALTNDIRQELERLIT